MKFMDIEAKARMSGFRDAEIAKTWVASMKRRGLKITTVHIHPALVCHPMTGRIDCMYKGLLSERGIA